MCQQRHRRRKRHQMRKYRRMQTEQPRDPWFFKGSRFCAGGKPRTGRKCSSGGMPEGQVRCHPFGYFTFYTKKFPGIVSKR